MDTHLTLINEDVVREREAAIRHAHEMVTITLRARTEDVETTDEIVEFEDEGAINPDDDLAIEAGLDDLVEEFGKPRKGDVLVVSLFTLLGAGFVALVAMSLRGV